MSNPRGYAALLSSTSIPHAQSRDARAVFAAWIKAGLTKLAAGCCGEKKQRPAVVERRIQALLSRNSRARGLFRVKVGTRDAGGATVDAVVPTEAGWSCADYVPRDRPKPWPFCGIG